MTNSGIGAKTVIFYALLMAGCFTCVFSMGHGYSRFAKDYTAAQNIRASRAAQPAQAAAPSADLGDIPARTVRFIYADNNAAQVFLHADFNLWGAYEIELEKSASGGFAKTLVLPQGEYKYYFSVDGAPAPDPQAVAAAFHMGREVSLKTVL
ncbi:MAG: hypothetical protein LBL61_04305 [Elusimicrobiota bacterium]|jgi:1,4-alpha-glucan branching enzyme|nr:hypothetical protein [Elusimicrobiota bacterium]